MPPAVSNKKAPPSKRPHKTKLSQDHFPFDIERAGPLVKAMYVEMILAGTSPRMAEMLALRQPPKIMTDDVAMAGMPTLANMNPAIRNAIVARARQYGYQPKDSDVYLDSVAVTPGDPRAFMNHGQGRGDIKKVLEARGCESDGLVKTKHREPEQEVTGQKLSRKIAERIYRNKVKDDPALAHKDKREVIGQIVEKHGGTGKID